MAFRAWQERNQAVDALRACAERLPDLFESAPVALALFDAGGALVHMNAAFGAMLGYAEDEMAGMAIADLILQCNLTDGADKLRELQAGAADWLRLEGSCRRRDGTTLWCRTLVTALRDERGRCQYYIAHVGDITDRKRAEEALRESEAKWRSLTEYSPDHIMLLDRDGNILFINHTISGLTREQVMGTCLYDHAPVEFRGNIQRAVDRVFETGEPDSYETEYHAPDGSIHYYEARVGPVRQSGVIAAVTVSGRDVTERQRAEEELRESEERFRRLAAASFEGIAIHEGGLIRDANEVLGQMFGYKVSELIGMHGVDLAAPESREALLRRIRSPDESRFELTGRRKDGSTFPIELRTRAVTYRGRSARVVAVHDITEHRLVAEARQQAREELEGRVERQLAKGNPYGLTFREFTVLNLAAAGKADKEIAVELAISPLTVHKHMGNILGKMDAASRTEASVRALREGLLD